MTLRLLSMQRRWGRLAAWWVVGVGVHCLPASPVRAQAGPIPLPPRAERQVIPAEDEPLADNGDDQAAAPLVPPEVVNQWIFGGNLQPEDGRKRLEQQLQLHLEELTEHCGLTAAQASKLRRAGQGDIARFLRQVGEIQRLVTQRSARQDLGQLINERVQPLQQTLQTGPFDENSLFVKAMVRTLDDSQRNACEQLAEQRGRAIFRSRVELAVAMMERQVPLLDEQRRAMVEWIVEHATPPPVRRNDLDLPWIYYQMSQIPEERQQAWLEGPQREMFQLFLRRVVLDQRQLLIERGLLDGATH